MSAANPAAGDTAKQAANSDKIGVYPKDYDTDALPERRTAAFARMAIIIATAEAFAIAGLAFALAALVPLQKVVPMVVASNDRGDEIINLTPSTLESPTVDYVAEIGLRNYVQNRYSIVASASQQQINWGQGSVVQLMSSPDAYKKFRDSALADMQRLRASSMVRKVRIDSVRKIGESTWQVEFITTDQPEEDVFGRSNAVRANPVSKTWISTYDIGFAPRNVLYSDRLNNPFGMTVQSVNDARRD